MLQRFFKSFQYAISGLRYIFREEENFYIQTYGALIAIAAGWLLQISRTDWLFLCLAIVLVMGTEIMNTILEDVANELEPNHNPLIGKIKDMMAAVVLINAIFALIVGSLIFLPRLF